MNLDSEVSNPEVSPGIFDELADLKRWVPYYLRQRFDSSGNPIPGKFDKVPSDGQNNLSHMEPSHWMTYAEAADLVPKWAGLSGVGLVFTGGIELDGRTLVGLDFDSVDFDKFELPFETYSERSPSGTGIRAFVWVPTSWAIRFKDDNKHRYPNCDHLEVYIGTGGRFLTLTFEPIDCIPFAQLEDLGPIAMEARERPPAALPEFTEGVPIDLKRHALNAQQSDLVNGKNTADMDRSAVLHGLVIRLIDDGCSPADVLATIAGQEALWGVCMDHRQDNPDKALQFARDEVARGFAKSKPGMRARLSDFNEKWKMEKVPVSPELAHAKEAPPRDLLIERPLTLDVLTTPVPPWPSAIGRFLPMGVVTELDGAHGIGKSCVGLHMALSMATGQEWHGLPTSHGRVVFMSKEDPYMVIVQRIQAWLESFDAAERPALLDKIRQNLKVYGCDETEQVMLTTSDGRACSIREDVIEELANRWDGVLAIFAETASLLHAGDEMNEHLLVLVTALKRLASRTGAALCLVRHISKSAAREAIEDSLVGRGGASFSDSVRSALLLRELTDKEANDIGIDLHKLESGCALLKLVHTKSNYGAKEDPVFLLRKPDPIFVRVSPRGELAVNGERLLLFMRKEAMLGNAEWSYSRLKGVCTEIGVSQGKIKGTLQHLEAEKRIGKMLNTRGGNHHVWVLSQ